MASVTIFPTTATPHPIQKYSTMYAPTVALAPFRRPVLKALVSKLPSARRHAAVRRWDGRLLMNLLSVNNLRGCSGTYTAPMRYKTNGSY